MLEAHAQLERRDERITELSQLTEMTQRDNDARHAAVVRDLRRQISDYQQRINDLAAGPPTAGPPSDVPALYDRIRDLEDRIRSA